MSKNDAAAGLTIGAVAARTGVSVPVLRAWEERYGFPRPARLHGGHRRYDSDDVARIVRVVEERRAGRTLASAIDLARQAARPELDTDVSGDATVHAGLRRLRPDLEVNVIGRRTMLALSNAIEDECLAQAEQATLTAAFQTVVAYRAAAPRWRQLAREAASTVVFADFDRSRTRRSVNEVSIPGQAALHREWAVVCDAPQSSAVLAGWERADGRFEALWSVEPDVVRLGTRIGRTIAARFAPRLELPPLPAATSDDEPVGVEPIDVQQRLRQATAVTNRVVAYLDRWSA